MYGIAFVIWSDLQNRKKHEQTLDEYITVFFSENVSSKITNELKILPTPDIVVINNDSSDIAPIFKKYYGNDLTIVSLAEW